MKLSDRHRVAFLFLLLFVCAASELFSQPLTLSQAIDLALAHNQTILLSAKENFASSQAGLAATEAAYANHLDFSFSTMRSYSKSAFETPGQGNQFLSATHCCPINLKTA